MTSTKRWKRANRQAPKRQLGEHRGESQVDRTHDAVAAVAESYGFDAAILVSVVQLPDGRWQVETSVKGMGPPTLGPAVGAQIRQAADELERRMTESAASLLKSLD